MFYSFYNLFSVFISDVHNILFDDRNPTYVKTFFKLNLTNCYRTAKMSNLIV